MPSGDEIFHLEERSATEEDSSIVNPLSATPGTVILPDEEELLLPPTPSLARSTIPKQVAEAINLMRWSLIDNTSCKKILRAILSFRTIECQTFIKKESHRLQDGSKRFLHKYGI